MSPPTDFSGFALCSYAIPWVNYFDPHFFEVPNVACRNRHAARLGNRCDLAIGLRDRPAPNQSARGTALSQLVRLFQFIPPIAGLRASSAPDCDDATLSITAGGSVLKVSPPLGCVSKCKPTMATG